MTFSEFSVNYPALHPGTDRTAIRFYSGSPDLSLLSRGTGRESVRRLFVTDRTVAGLTAVQPFAAQFRNGAEGSNVLVVLPSGEAHKTIEAVLTIIKTAIEHSFNRNDIFTGIGGGVVCDMTAFAASIFKRGTGVELVPTTLLAMADAAVGGKSGCDFESYKNMIGTFYPAQTLYVWPQFVQTLPDTEYRSGLAEVVKTALLYSEDLYEQITADKDSIMARDSQIVGAVTAACARAKAAVVEQDFTEKNIRMQLNFGHTFGHALETVAGLGMVSHGDAVAWGISRALALSERLGLCAASYRESVCRTLASYGWETGPVHRVLSGRADPAGQLLAAMKKDKKNSGNRIRVILQKEITSTVITEADDADIRAVLENGRI